MQGSKEARVRKVHLVPREAKVQPESGPKVLKAPPEPRAQRRLSKARKAIKARPAPVPKGHKVLRERRVWGLRARKVPRDSPALALKEPKALKVRQVPEPRVLKAHRDRKVRPVPARKGLREHKEPRVLALRVSREPPEPREHKVSRV